MTKETKKQPKLRFPEFTDDWKQSKLRDVCDYVDYRGKTPVKTDSGVFLVTAKNVKDGYIDYGASQEYISEDNYEEVMRRGKPEIGDVLITTEAPCGNVAQVNRADIALAQRIIKYRGQSNIIDNSYLKYYLLSPEFQNILNTKSSGGTVRGIKGSILHQMEIKYPKYEEQFKIGSCFNNIDSLIALHQRELDELKELKKCMLQKMFPKKGEKIPEIRFPEFTGDWEQHKFEDVVTIGSGKDYKHLESGNVPVYGTGGYMLSVNQALSENEDAVGIGRKGTIDKPYILRAPFWTVDTLFYCIPNKGFDLTFTNCLFQNVDWKKKDESTGVPSLSKVIINNVKTYVPSLSEQQRIGEYFSNLDNLITLQQKEIDGYKELKKGLLQQMFC